LWLSPYEGLGRSAGAVAKTTRLSAGLLLFRHSANGLDLLIVHMGGPFWARKDAGAWSIPKGEYEAGEDPMTAAFREFKEELGSPPPEGEIIALGDIRQSTGKTVTTFALSGDFDTATAVSNVFEMEWPRGSGRIQSFPEVDRASWFDAPTAKTKLVKGQIGFVDRLIARL
jgi:predicted NUDIX family NTP pyrophosphohydrolase